MDNLLNLYDISIEDAVPNSKIFERVEKIEQHVNVHSNFEMETKDKFYNDGIVGKLISNGKKSKNIKFTKFCDRNWLVGVAFMMQYEKKCIDINVINYGNGSNGFIAGLHYFMRDKDNVIQWLGIDSKNNANHKCYRKLSKYLTSKGKNVEDYTICESDLVNIVHNEDTTLLCNNISPKNYKINILLAILSCNNDAILLTKILEPEYWNGSYKKYLLLFSLIYTKVSVFRFPMCHRNKAYFQYYLIGTERKKIMYNINRKLSAIYAYEWEFTNSVTELESVKKYNANIEKIASKYINVIGNPNTSLHEVINKMGNYI